MKKILAILLCLAMALTMSLTAFAATELDETPATDKKGGEYGIGVNGKLVDLGIANDISVDIIWEKMEFTYNEAIPGEWNPDNHSYDAGIDGSWADDEKPGITLRNHSDSAIDASFKFVPAYGMAIDGTFYYQDGIYGQDGYPLVVELATAVGTVRDDADSEKDGTPTDTVYFSVSGDPIGADRKLGTVVISIDRKVTEWVTVTTAEELQEALASGKGIKLGGNIVVDKLLVVSNNVTNVLDLAGFTLTANIHLDAGRLTVTDSVGGGALCPYDEDSVVIVTAEGTKLYVKAGTYYGIDLGGEAVVSGGTVAYSYGIWVMEKGNLTVTGGMVGGSGYSVYNDGKTVIENGEFYGVIQNNGVLVFENGTVDGTHTSEYSLINYGKATINGGDFTGTLDLYKDSVLTINDGNFYCEEYQVVYAYYGKVTINGGSFQSRDDDAVCAYHGSVYINGGSFRGGYRAVYNYGGSVYINGGDFYGVGENSLKNDDGYTVINGGKFAVENLDSYYTISIYSGEVLVTGGVIDGDISNGGYLTITGGSVGKGYYALDNYGTAVIEGGVMKGYLYNSGDLTITGGQFAYDPSDYVDSSVYNVTYDGKMYTVYPYYISNEKQLKTALEAVKTSGGGLELASNIILSETLEISGCGTANATVFVNLGGYTVSGNITVCDDSYIVMVNGTITYQPAPSDDDTDTDIAAINVNNAHFAAMNLYVEANGAPALAVTDGYASIDNCTLGGYCEKDGEYITVSACATESDGCIVYIGNGTAIEKKIFIDNETEVGVLFRANDQYVVNGVTITTETGEEHLVTSADTDFALFR